MSVLVSGGSVRVGGGIGCGRRMWRAKDPSSSSNLQAPSNMLLEARNGSMECLS